MTTRQYDFTVGPETSVVPSSGTATGSNDLLTLGQATGTFVPYSSLPLAVASGGTAATTASAGFNALSPLTTYGDQLARSSSSNTRVASGTHGQFWMASTGSTVGVAWNTVFGSTYSAASAANDVAIFDSSGFITSENQLAITRGGTNASTASGAINNISPLTTKGDLIGYTGTAHARLASGSEGQALVVSSGSSVGFAWSNVATNPLTASGSLIVGGASGAATELVAGNVLDVLTMTAANTVAWAANIYPNIIANGAFDLWQRTTSSGTITAAVSTIFNADRYVIRGVSTGGNVDIARSTDVPSNGKFEYSLSCTRTSGTSTQIAQKIEGAEMLPYNGDTMTFSCWVKTSAASTVSIHVATPDVKDTFPSDINSNTGMTVIGSTTTPSVSAGSWSQVSRTFTIPNGRGLIIRVADSGTTATLNTTGWMLTKGSSVPLSFRRAGRNIGEEIRICQRYYNKSYDLATAPATNTQTGIFSKGTRAASTTVLLTVDHCFPVLMRISPTLTLYPEDGSSANTVNRITTSSPGTEVTAATGFTSERGFTVGITGDTGLTAADAYVVRGHYVAEAEL